VTEFQQFCRRFIPADLRNKFASDGETENGLTELLNVFEAGGEARKVLSVEVGDLFKGEMSARLCTELAVVQAVESRRHQSISSPLSFGLRRLQSVAEPHQLINFCYDAVLFGVRRQRESEINDFDL
jgi:hypothetical protein